MSKLIGNMPEVPHLLSQVPRLSVSMSRKINLGSYESTDIFVSLAVDMTDEGLVGKTLDKVEKILNKKVDEILEDRENKN